jgi:hypothetical protein
VKWWIRVDMYQLATSTDRRLRGRRLNRESVNRTGAMTTMDDSDLELVRALIPHWYATRRWAEELLCRALGLQNASEVLQQQHRGRKVLAGSMWTYQTHGIGVNVGRGISSGGIDFDFDKPDPDPWRLCVFAEKQLDAGNLGAAYAELIDDKERFRKAAEAVLASGGAG